MADGYLGAALPMALNVLLPKQPLSPGAPGEPQVWPKLAGIGEAHTEHLPCGSTLLQGALQ